MTDNNTDFLYLYLFRQSPLVDARDHFVTFFGWHVDTILSWIFITVLALGLGFTRQLLAHTRWRVEWAGATSVAPPAKVCKTEMARPCAVILWACQSALGCVCILLANTLHVTAFVGLCVGSALGYWLFGPGCFGMSSGSCPGGEALIWA